MDRSPVFNAPPRGAVTCPRCGHLFEASIEVDGVRIRGHVPGDPFTCHPTAGVERDARRRREQRRGLR